MTVVFDGLVAWLVAVVGDAGRRGLTDVVVGPKMERALAKAAAEAIRRTAAEVTRLASDAETVARIISEVFTLPGPEVVGDAGTLLEEIGVAVARQMAVLGDRGITGQQVSSADLLGIDWEDIADALTRHLVRVILRAGANGGALEAFAGQLNHDATHLQNEQAAGTLRSVFAGLAVVLDVVTQVRDLVAEMPFAAAVLPGRPGLLAAEVLPAPLGRLPRRLAGRDDLVGLLADLAVAPDGQVHVVAGMGGCGKSAVALEVARQARAAGCRVWWVSGGDRSSVTGLLLRLAGRLGAADGEVAEARSGGTDPSDVLWPRLESERRWVLVLDNADDLAVLTSGDREVSDGSGWLRPTRSGLLVVTSRISDQGAWGPHAAVHPVGPLSAEDGTLVLADLAPGAGDRADAVALAERLGGLALALHQAGTYLGSPFAGVRTFTAYAAALAERFGELLGRGDTDRERVTATWELSLAALAAQGRGHARMLLRVVSCFAAGVPVPPDVLDPDGLAPVCGSRAAAEECLSGLLAVGLIGIDDPPQDAGRPSVIVHPLVAETIRHEAGSALPESLAVAARLIAGSVQRLDQEDPQAHGGWLAILPHMAALMRGTTALPSADLVTLAEAAGAMSRALLWGGSQLASLEIAELALKRTAELGMGSASMRVLCFRQASAHRVLGQSAQAETELRQVLHYELRALGPDHPDTLITRTEIAGVLADQGKAAEAEAEYRHLLNAEVRVLGTDHEVTLGTRNDVARLLNAQGNPAAAETEYRKILEATLRLWNPEHRNTLSARHNLASALAAQGKVAEAEAEYRQVLDTKRRILGASHPSTLATWNDIAWVQATQGRLADAESEYRKVLGILEQTLGTEHPYAKTTRQSLANVIAVQEKPDIADHPVPGTDSVADDDPRSQ